MVFAPGGTKWLLCERNSGRNGHAGACSNQPRCPERVQMNPCGPLCKPGRPTPHATVETEPREMPERLSGSSMWCENTSTCDHQSLPSLCSAPYGVTHTHFTLGICVKPCEENHTEPEDISPHASLLDHIPKNHKQSAKCEPEVYMSTWA